MSDDTLKRAQRVWANLGGLGPVPESLMQDGCLPDESANALAYAKQRVAAERHDLRLRLIGAALPAYARSFSDAESGLKAAARAAVGAADAVLALLEAEAKEAAK